ncbi:hypothetical protein O3M35_001737 [Rhynocoris fuscipes]|uniref:DNA repair and recombination protein RAD54-like n=1 Tax=Rhynocoris fuscipes TaxID=488301 RepID=A0AAW1CR26_9HEMI
MVIKPVSDNCTFNILIHLINLFLITSLKKKKMEEMIEDSPPVETSEVHPLKIDVSAIQNIEKHEQATELQSLDLKVYDIDTLEKGIIAQVDQAIGQTDAEIAVELEDGEIVEDYYEKKIRMGEMTPFGTLLEDKNSLPDKSKTLKRADDCITEFERYLKHQAELQAEKHKSRKKPVKKIESSLKIDKQIVEKVKNKRSEKEREKHFNNKDNNSWKSTINKKKKFKDKSTHSSGSEYFPSDEYHSSDDNKSKSKSKNRTVVRKKRKKHKKKELLVSDRDSDSLEWDSSDSEEPLIKRKKLKEMDDGDVDLFTERMKTLDWKLGEDDLHTVCDNFKCPKSIWDRLYLYQQVAVKWFWELDRKRCGGILGDEMGLGKTIQVISFLAGLHVSKLEDYDTEYKGLGPSIIVCPTTVMHQWVREFHNWYPPLRVVILHESGTFSGKDRSRLINALHTYTHGVLITSYSALVQFQDRILEKKWHYVILDEGHKIRNPNAQVTIVAKQFNTPHRLILSGSPLQNNLRELWSLFDFIYPGKLGTLHAFTTKFQSPILQGGYTNASKFQVRLAYKFALILKETITPYLLRRMKCDVEEHIGLPSKTEQVLFCRLTEDQRHYYKGYIDSLDIESLARGKAKMFIALSNMRKICNHPDLYSGGPNKNFKLTLNNTEDEEKSFGYWGKAGKMIVVHTLLKIWKEQGHRVLLFTQGKKMLLILEEYVKRRGYKHLKLDGQTCISSRQPLIDRFNTDETYFIMLLTTKVGGLGVNLTGANRVVIYDPDWNPATDTQARERAWRIGQRNDVTIYRLITAGTIEEKIYHRQIFKQFLSNKVLKDPRQRRFFKSNDLVELFTLNDGVENGTIETAAIFAGTGSEINLKKRKVSDEKPNNTSISTNKDNSLDNSKKLCEQDRITHRKHKKDKHKKFEGHLVPHLVKRKRIKKNTNKEEKPMSQDEYVLHHLFKKSGVETVLKHDTIVECGPSDYALVEAEAEQIAQEAIKHIRESRAEIPQVRRPSFVPPIPKGKQNEKNSLLAAIKKRNSVVENVSDEKQLVNRMIDWLCSQGGTASTDEIVKEFQSKVGPGKTPLFKSLLTNIAVFYRAPDKIGYWTVKDEYK